MILIGHSSSSNDQSSSLELGSIRGCGVACNTEYLDHLDDYLLNENEFGNFVNLSSWKEH